MATMPKPDLMPRPLTATELLAIRDTSEFEAEYRRQAEAVKAHDLLVSKSDSLDYFDWDVPGWSYDAEL